MATQGAYAFPHEERMTKKRDYELVYREGSKRVGHGFVGHFLRREGLGRRFGCSVSRRVGNAVARNRVKRYLREIYRLHRPRLNSDIYIVFVARPSSARLDYAACRKAVRWLLYQEGAMHD